MMQRRSTRQRGAALIVAMLVVALAATVAARFAYRVQLEDRKLENRATLAQARWVLRAAEHWALVLLRDDARQNNTDHLEEIWAKTLPPVDAEGFRVAGVVEDMQGRFNLNSLIDKGQVAPAALAGFTRLLEALNLNPALADLAVDWLDGDTQTANGEAEPHEAPNHPLLRAEELIPCVGEDAWGLLAAHVTALPESVPINVNTATMPVLMAATQDMFPVATQTLIENRRQAWFRDVADFTDRMPRGASIALPVSVNSQYFKILVQATQGRVAVASEALLTRAGSIPFVWRNTP